MVKFSILKKSKKSNARLGVLETPHGIVETPTLVGVGTYATMKTLTSEEIPKTKTQIMIANTYHLHIRPGGDVIKKAGGLNKFMNLDIPTMTDSGGFQVLSLGFGRDHTTGKIIKNKEAFKGVKIIEGQQPKTIKITADGVAFRSYLDGKELFLGPKESIKIQEKIGADIILAFDEATSPLANREYTRASIEKTHRWAKVCIDVKKTDQALFGIVQGGKFKDLRYLSSRYIGSLPFDGFAIGGEYGNDKKKMAEIIGWGLSELPENKPRHLLGVGHPEDLKIIIKSGIDLFDCIAPTHYARHGVAFTSKGRVDFNKPAMLKDKKPVDAKCKCPTCQTYKRSYIAHLIRAKEITGLRLLTFHNLFFFHTLVENLREKIKSGHL